MSAEDRARELGLDLRQGSAPVANYVPAVRQGNTVYLSGHIPAPGPDSKRPVGKVGAEISVEDGYAIAREVAAALLATLRAEIGSLDRVERVLKVNAFVNSASDFTQQPQVANGASDLLVEVFGEKGRHTRTAVGVAALPLGVPVEIDLIVAVGPE